MPEVTLLMHKLRTAVFPAFFLAALMIAAAGVPLRTAPAADPIPNPVDAQYERDGKKSPRPSGVRSRTFQSGQN